MTVNWKSGVNGLFETGSDWSSGAIPGAADDVLIAAAGTYAVTMDQSESVNSLRLNAAGATFAEGGAGVTLTVATNFSVTAGTLSLTADQSASKASIIGGTLSTGAAGVLTVGPATTSTSASYFSVESAVSLSGTTIISDSYLILDGGGTLGGSFRGAGTLDLTSHTFTAKASAFSGLQALLINGGTLALGATSGVLAPNVFITNSGVLDIQGSTTITLTATTIGDGPLGVLLMETTENLISGPGTLVTTGNTISTGFDVADAGNQTDDLIIGGGLTWLNQGTVTDDGIIAMNTSSTDTVTILNAAGATFDFEGLHAGLIDHGFTGADIISNLGTLEKTAGSTASDGDHIVTVAAALINSGLMDIQGGTLALTGGGAISGTLSGAGTLLLYSGSYTVNGLSGTGHLSVGAGAAVTYTGNTIGTSFTLDNNQTLAIASGATQTLSGAFIVGDASGGGTITGPGKLVTSGATTINDLAGSQALGLNGSLAWTNSGTVSAFGLIGSSGAAITNTGVFNFASDSATLTGAGSTDVFRNTGTLGKTAGTGSSFLSDVITSTGTINVATGALVLGAGGSVSGVLSGAGALHLSNGTFITAGLSGNGTLAIDNLPGTGYGTLTVNVSSTISTGVRLDGNATIAGTAGKILTLAGPFAINTVESSPSPDGGNLTGPGTLTTTGATTIGTVTNGNNYAAITLSSGITWINSATGTVTDAGSGTSNGGTIANAGVFNFATDAASMISNSASDSFRNTGTIGKTGGTGSSLVTDVVTSTGTINVATGALIFGGGGSVSGVLTGAGSLHLSGGSFTTMGISGSGNLFLENLPGVQYGTLTASATSTITASVHLDANATLAAAAGKTLTLTGPLIINTVESTPSPDGGNLTGPGTITTTGITTIGTVTNGNNFPAVALGSGITWINSATGTVTDAGYGTSSNATIVNAGVFNFTTDAAGITAALASDTVINTGTLGKTGGTGTSLVTDMVASSGTINVATGALVLGGGGSVSGVLTGAGSLHLSGGSFTTTGISGSGNLFLENLPGVQYGTLTASATSTITASVHLDANATLGAAAGATLTLLNQILVNTVESSPSPDGGNLTGPGTIVTDNLVTIGAVTNGNNFPALTLSGGVTWSNPSTVHDAGLIASNTATIANAGVFDFTADSGAITAAGAADAFLNSGTLAKTGGTGTSTIADSVTNNFVIEAASGTLAITNAILGTGILHIDAGATLDIATIFASQSVTFTGGGGATLRLETPASASFTGFAAGDRLDLAGNPVSAATISGTTLTVTTGAGSFTYVSAGLAGDVAAISADAANGSFVSIYRAATAAHTPEPLAFGNHHVGDITTNKLALTVSNTDVADGYSEKLNANLSGATAGFTAAGSVSGIAAGASNSTSLTVTLDTSTAGAKAGTAKLALATNGSGVDGRGSTPLAGQTVNLTGAVYAYAAAHFVSTSVTLGNQHVGAAAHGVLSLTNSAAAGGFSEGLDAKFIGGAGGATGTGTATLIAAGATDSSSLVLGLSASAAGIASGTETLTLISDGAGTSGLGTTALGTQTVTVSGAFYNLAVGHLASATLNLGIIHANTAATGALSVGNSAAAGSYSESLDAGLSGASAGLTAAGTITGLLAGATNATALQLSVTTAATGAYSGTATLGLVSDGAGTSGLGTTSLGSQTVTVTATVDNYALAAFADAGGPAITGTSTNATINLGSAIQGGAGLVLHLGAKNAATGTADLLTGTISSAGAAGFTNAGFGSIGVALSAGQIETAQTVTLSTTTAGVFTETVLLSTAGTNASGYNGALATETLTITGTITPSVFTTYTLALGPNTITGADGKGDIFIATAGALNSRDRLTGGNGANSITLSGAGLFDVNAPALLSNIPTINAHEGQAASGTHANTTQTVLLRDGATQTLNVAAGTPVAGNANVETIAIYGGTGTETIKLASGADHVYLSTGTDSITLGGAANSVAAGGGSATIHATAAFAGASIVGGTSGSTTLAVSTGGAVNLNAADTRLTVQLSGASQLKLGALSFITALGSAGADTITAGGAGQTLTGGLGADSLMGAVGGGDLFADTAAGLNGDTIGNWTTGDQIDVRDIAGATANYAAGTLTLAGGGHSAAIKITGSFAQGNFVVVGSDGAGGTLIGFHS